LETTIRAGLRSLGLIAQATRCEFFDRLDFPVYRLEVRAADGPGGLPVLRAWGKGTLPESAKAGAWAEAVERLAALRPFRPQTITASYRSVRHWALDPARLLPSRLDLVPSSRQPDYDPDRPILWVEGRCLADGRVILLPASYVYLRPAGADGLVVATSSGLAAGADRPSALLHALCELVERDATMIVMRNRLVMDDIEVDSLDASLAERFADSGLVLYLKDFTSDIRLATVGAVIVDPGGRYPSHTYGFGTHPDPVVACWRAVTEAAQSRVIHLYHAVRLHQVSFPDAQQRRAIFAHLTARGLRRKPVCWLPKVEGAGPEELSARCLAEICRVLPDAETYVASLDLPETGLAVVRLIVPGLVPPQANYPFVTNRLLEVPFRLGLRASAVRAEELWSGTWPH